MVIGKGLLPMSPLDPGNNNGALCPILCLKKSIKGVSFTSIKTLKIYYTRVVTN